jgi:peptide/nickel transport system substrate-binding protein
MGITEILPKKYVEQMGDDSWQSKPIGTGPFKWVESVKGSYYTLERNPDYWMGAPKVARLRVRTIPEIATRVAALQAGEVDLIMQLPPDQAASIQRTGGLRLESNTNPRVVFIELFPKSPSETGKPLEDVRVRQALNYAVDVETIIKTILGGYANRVATIVPAETVGYDPSIPAYSYEPARARQLLSDAGYGNGLTIDNGRSDWGQRHQAS